MVKKVKLRRGQKLCKHCGAVNAARSTKCNTCGKFFISKNTPIKNEVKDWKELEQGQHIKIIQGNGLLCYGIGKNNTGIDFVYMGERKKSLATGIIQAPHRIVKIKTRKRK